MEVRHLAVDAKRKAAGDDVPAAPWKLTKCQKLSSENFMVQLEICSPDSFLVKPLRVDGYTFPGEAACFEKLSECLSNVLPSHYTQNHVGGEACVFKLTDYDAVVKSLKIEHIDYKDIPYVTRRAVSILSRPYVEGRWEPCRPEHLSDVKVDELMGKLPKFLMDVLLPFQVEGVKFGLRRGGRCLIADEMGLGKTLQAIAIASCFMNEGPILVVCPAILRYTWAEELEHWLPSCLPSDIHLVFGHQNNPANLARSPKVVVISYKMLHNLKKSISKQKWAVLIVDESHHVRCTKRPSSEAGETQAVLDVSSKINRIVLLSGTPSLSRPFDIFHQINILWPGLLGKDKIAFAKTYCSMSSSRTSQGIVYQDFSKGIRLEELNVLLKQTVMIRRLKEHVLMQLPPIRRQIINLVLKKSDFDSAIAICSRANDDASTENDVEDGPSEEDKHHDKNAGRNSSKPSNQVIGIAKLSGFIEWLLMHPIIAESDDDEKFESSQSSHKMIIFAHHHKVTDRVQEFLCEKGIKFVRIDARDASAKDRQQAIHSFQHSKEVKIALVGILAGSSGLDLSAAQNVVFLELPEKISDFQQAESRAHRRGQTKAVNVYIFCAKDTSDESHWKRLNRSLHRTSSTVDGKYGSLKEIMVEDVSLLETIEGRDKTENLLFEGENDGESSSIELVRCSQYSCGEEMQSDEVFDGTTISRNEDANSSDSYLKYSYKNNAFIAPDVNNEELMAPNGTVEEYIHEGRRENRVLPHTSHEADKSNVMELPSDGEPIDQVEADTDCIPAHSLRFEVSKYTGRIHLYSCILGVEARPTPLFKNFRPEELETKDPPIHDSKKLARKCINYDLIYRPALVYFVKEWNSLRPIEQSKLYNKPLQLPLAVELCLNESQNHDKEGLLKGGSKKRGTSLDDISHPLPPNAVWKSVSLFHGKKERHYLQGWTLLGEPLCKLCQKVCKKKSAKEPEFFEDFFCDLECYEEYRLRTSNRYLRKGLAQIEHGICTNCHLDCRKLVKNIKPLSLEKRREFVMREAPKMAARRSLLEKLISDPSEGNAWHADHIVPVYRGGGECRLENMRTLCVACHAEVTAAQCTERRSERAKAKKQLNRMLAKLKAVQDAAKITEEKDHDENNTFDDELLVNVPGSSYGTTNNVCN
ncbi:DNA annealing helicase and endonuclease ZRANB3 [Cynara cardunculus var. scolymus]|uniref:DNA annealing helicase and endonuclease ZRANB3 n=1 Tax=Cynara cardunculus var. scolymus TaxID=59895 RepID=UPI000D62B1A4|nr:DNA annealing helicase and endonuclease ZRANB3 [Cynara cardunculus var. scolymus]